MTLGVVRALVKLSGRPKWKTADSIAMRQVWLKAQPLSESLGRMCGGWKPVMPFKVTADTHDKYAFSQLWYAIVGGIK